MSKVYGQKPTSAISAVVRHDELTDSVTQESNLKRQQSIGQIGETLPLVFCKRSNNVGGTWISPRVIGIGLEQNTMSLIFPLSVGKTGGLSKSQIFIGYNKFDRYTGAYENHAYEKIPTGLNISYNPGGSKSWTEKLINSNIRSNLPTASGDRATTIKSQTDTCTGMEFSVKADIRIDREEYASIDGYAGYNYSMRNGDWEIYSPKARSNGSWSGGSPPPGWLTEVGEEIQAAKLQTWNERSKMSPRIGDYAQNGPSWYEYTTNYDRYQMRYVNTLHKKFAFKTNYYVKCQVKNMSNNKVVKTVIWDVKSATTTFKITNLSPAPYEFIITYHSLTNGKTSALKPFTPPVTGSDKGSRWNSPGASANVLYQNWYRNLAARLEYLRNLPGRWGNASDKPIDKSIPSNKVDNRSMDVGTINNVNDADRDASVQLLSTVETVKRTLEWPDIPGGSYQVRGNYKDMTLFGIRAAADELAGSDDPGYIVQTHAFVNNGIFVDDIRNSSTAKASSDRYPDLVNYLMRNALKLDSTLIDMPSLRLISNMNVKYKLLYNGVMQTTSSYQEWAFRTSPYFWSTPTQINGKYGLAPVVPLNSDGSVKTGAITPKVTFGTNDIIEGSYNMVMESSQERQDFCCVMVYKESTTKKVAQTRTVEVRYKGKAINGPFETHDLTEFCCDVNHAIRAAMYILARRRYVTHTLSVTVNNRAALIEPRPGRQAKSCKLVAAPRIQITIKLIRLAKDRMGSLA